VGTTIKKTTKTNAFFTLVRTLSSLKHFLLEFIVLTVSLQPRLQPHHKIRQSTDGL